MMHRRVAIIAEGDVVELDAGFGDRFGTAAHPTAQMTAAQRGTTRQVAASSRCPSDRRKPEGGGKAGMFRGGMDLHPDAYCYIVTCRRCRAVALRIGVCESIGDRGRAEEETIDGT